MLLAMLTWYCILVQGTVKNSRDKINVRVVVVSIPCGAGEARNAREPITVLHRGSFIHSGHFYSAPSSPLLLRGAPVYSTDTVSEFHAEAHRQLQVKDF